MPEFLDCPEIVFHEELVTKMTITSRITVFNVNLFMICLDLIFDS
jgi:hypothetical protein